MQTYEAEEAVVQASQPKQEVPDPVTVDQLARWQNLSAISVWGLSRIVQYAGKQAGLGGASMHMHSLLSSLSKVFISNPLSWAAATTALKSSVLNLAHLLYMYNFDSGLP